MRDDQACWITLYTYYTNEISPMVFLYRVNIMFWRIQIHFGRINSFHSGWRVFRRPILRESYHHFLEQKWHYIKYSQTVYSIDKVILWYRDSSYTEFFFSEHFVIMQMTNITVSRWTIYYIDWSMVYRYLILYVNS